MKILILFSVLTLFASLSNGTQSSTAHTYTINGISVSGSEFRRVLNDNDRNDDRIMGGDEDGGAGYAFSERHNDRKYGRRRDFAVDGRRMSEFELRRILIRKKENIPSSMDQTID